MIKHFHCRQKTITTEGTEEHRGKRVVLFLSVFLCVLRGYLGLGSARALTISAISCTALG